MECVAAHQCFRQAANTQHTLEVSELYSSFQTYMNSHFNSNVLIFPTAYFNAIQYNTIQPSMIGWQIRLARQLPPLPCYCADHCQLKQGWMPSGQRNETDWHFFNYWVYCVLSKSICILVKINCHAFCSSSGGFIFLKPVFRKLLKLTLLYSTLALKCEGFKQPVGSADQFFFFCLGYSMPVAMVRKTPSILNSNN